MTENISKNNNLKKDRRASGAVYLLALLPIIIILLSRLIPFLEGFFMSFKDYGSGQSFDKGVFVGLSNYRALFKDEGYFSIIVSTFKLKISYLLMTSFLALVLALIISLIRFDGLRRFFSGFFLLPYFIPALVLGFVLIYTMNNEGLFFLLSRENMMEADKFNLIYPIIETIKSLGIPLMFALYVINSKRLTDDGEKGFIKLRLLPALKAIAIFFIIQLSVFLTLNLELFSYFYDPALGESLDIVDNFIYRTRFISGDIAISQSAYNLKIFIEFILSLLAFFLIDKFLSKDLSKDLKLPESIYKRKGSIVGFVLIFFIVEIYLLVTLVPFGTSLLASIKEGDTTIKILLEELKVLDISASLIINKGYIINLLVFFLINVGFSLLLAYPLTVKDLWGRNGYLVLLIFILALGPKGNYQYYFLGTKNSLDNKILYLFATSLSIMNVLGLSAIYRVRHRNNEELKEDSIKGRLGHFAKNYLPKAIIPALGLGLLDLARMWSSSSQNYVSLMGDFGESSSGGAIKSLSSYLMEGDMFRALPLEVFKALLFISLPAIIILLVVLVLFRDEIFVGQIRS